MGNRNHYIHVREAMNAVLREIDANLARWGTEDDLDPAVWVAIITEEVGEYAQAVLHDRFGGRAAGTEAAELIQCAAVCVQRLAVIAAADPDALPELPRISGDVWQRPPSRATRQAQQWPPPNMRDPVGDRIVPDSFSKTNIRPANRSWP